MFGPFATSVTNMAPMSFGLLGSVGLGGSGFTLTSEVGIVRGKKISKAIFLCSNLSKKNQWISALACKMGQIKN